MFRRNSSNRREFITNTTLNAAIDEKMETYVAESELTATLNDYVENTTLETTLEDYGSNMQEVTGPTSGGVISINALDNTKVDISAGTGVIIDYISEPGKVKKVDISWPAMSAVDPGISAFTVWVGIMQVGEISTPVFVLEPTPLILRFACIIGRIWSSVGSIATQITNVGYYKRPAYQVTSSFRDFITQIGSLNVSGNSFTAYNTTELKLKKSIGRSYRYWTNPTNEDNLGEENIHEDTDLTPVTLYGYHRQGVKTVEQLTTLNPNHYDLAGVKTIVPSGYYTIQEVWYYPLSQVVSILYGQRVYLSKPQAVKSLYTEDKHRNDDILQGAIFRGYIIIQQGVTNLTEAIIVEETTINKPSATSRNTMQYYTKSYAFADYGSSDINYVAGFYEYNTTASSLGLGGTVVIGTANVAYAARLFIVSGGPSTGTITISGTSINTTTGVRTALDSEVLVSDLSSALLNNYYETVKVWIGVVTVTKGGSGTFNFNVGLCKYENFLRSDVLLVDFNIVGKSSAGASNFDVQVIHHQPTGWIYAASGFASPASHIVCSLLADYVTETALANEEYFSYTRKNLNRSIKGETNEGVIIEITQTTNDVMRYATVQLGVLA